jgi:sortase A
MLNYSLKSNFKRIIQYMPILGSFVFGLILLILPFYPELEFRYNKKFHPEKFSSSFYFKEVKETKSKPVIITNIVSENNNETIKTIDTLPEEKKPEPKKYFNDIIIPSIALDISIFEGSNEKVLDQGAWLKPNGSNPGENGNIILTGHRYTYFNGVRPFYNMDKVVKGDEISIIWRGEKIDYKVLDKFTVKPQDTWVENQREGKYLTIYTCEGLDAA